MRRVEAASYVLTELVALGHIPEAEAFPVVRQMCRSIDPRVRANAVRAVMLFEPTGPAHELLDEVLEDSDPEVAAAAGQTRGIIRGAKVQELFGAG
jgi:hypothetical protein